MRWLAEIFGSVLVAGVFLALLGAAVWLGVAVILAVARGAMALAGCVP